VISVDSERVVTSAREWLEVGDVMNHDVVTTDPEETVRGAAHRMAEKGISSVVIVDRGQVMGILTETDLVRRVCNGRYDLEKTSVAEVMSCPVITTGEHESVLAAGEIMERNRVKRLPVLRGDEVVGIVTQTDIVRVLTSSGTRQKVSEIMSRGVFGIQRSETVASAAGLMSLHGISSVVIFDGGEVVGVFTERDFLKRVIAAGRAADKTRVEEVMSSSVMSVSPEYAVFNAKKVMESTDIQRLAVVEGGKVLGIVTQTDIFMAIKERLQAEQAKHMQLLEESESGIYTTDMDGVITYVNPAMVRLLEVDGAEELIGQEFLPDEFWVDEDDRRRVRGELSCEQVKTVELALRTRGGRKVYVTCFSTFTRDVHADINGRQGTLHDITAGKVAEAELEAETARRREVEAELRRRRRFWSRFHKNPRIMKRWYRTEAAYREAVRVWQEGQEADRVMECLKKAVDCGVSAVRLAGVAPARLTEVDKLYEYLDSPRVTGKDAVDETRSVLNQLGRKTPCEANLWYIECREEDV